MPPAVLMMFSVLALLAWPTAKANHFYGATGNTGCGAPNMADNATHSFYYDASLPTYMRDKMNEIRTESYNPTDINTVTSTDPNSQTDVVVYQQNYTNFCGVAWDGSGGSTTALTSCVSLSGSACQKFEVRFDSSYTGGATAAQRKFLTCHETGHTLGLGHRLPSSSCMIPFPLPPETSIDQHDRDAINAHY